MQSAKFYIFFSCFYGCRFGLTPTHTRVPSDSSSPHLDNSGGEKPTGYCEKWTDHEGEREKGKGDRWGDGRGRTEEVHAVL